MQVILDNPNFKYESGFQSDVQEFMKARGLFAKYYQALPDYDKRKGDLLDAYNAWIDAYSGQWDRKLQIIIQRYFDNDSLKVVS